MRLESHTSTASFLCSCFVELFGYLFLQNFAKNQSRHNLYPRLLVLKGFPEWQVSLSRKIWEFSWSFSHGTLGAPNVWAFQKSVLSLNIDPLGTCSHCRLVLSVFVMFSTLYGHFCSCRSLSSFSIMASMCAVCTLASWSLLEMQASRLVLLLFTSQIYPFHERGL